MKSPVIGSHEMKFCEDFYREIRNPIPVPDFRRAAEIKTERTFTVALREGQSNHTRGYAVKGNYFCGDRVISFRSSFQFLN